MPLVVAHMIVYEKTGTVIDSNIHRTSNKYLAGTFVSRQLSMR